MPARNRPVSKAIAKGEALSQASNDRNSVLAARGGDRSAFGNLVTSYQRRLFSLSLMMLREPSDVEDNTQDAFVRAFKCLEQYDVSRPFYPWLATIAVRLAQTRLGRRARDVKHKLQDADQNLEVDEKADALGDLLEAERSESLWNKVSTLPASQRTAVLLYYRQDMKINEVAQVLGVTGGTVKTLLFRARRKLKVSIALKDASQSQDQEELQ